MFAPSPLEPHPATVRVQPVILSGGFGARLWPLSRETLPKQFLRLTGERSLLQATLARLAEMSAVAPGLALEAPLIVSVVVRSYGWQLILANSRTGLLNWMLLQLGLTEAPLSILYSEMAVVIGSLHVFFPMMVLPLASALGKIDPNLEDSARTLGAPWWMVFWRITLPLSVPGLVAGFTLVFSLTAGSFVTPVILGGTSTTMLGNLIEQQIFVVYNWPFGAAIAMVLVLVVFAINTLSMRLLEGRRLRRIA